jgi:hypothetical protein
MVVYFFVCEISLVGCQDRKIRTNLNIQPIERTGLFPGVVKEMKIAYSLRGNFSAKHSSNPVL